MIRKDKQGYEWGFIVQRRGVAQKIKVGHLRGSGDTENNPAVCSGIRTEKISPIPRQDTRREISIGVQNDVEILQIDFVELSMRACVRIISEIFDKAVNCQVIISGPTEKVISQRHESKKGGHHVDVSFRNWFV